MACRLAGLPELTTAFDAARAWSSRAAEVVELFAGADASRKPLPQVGILLALHLRDFLSILPTVLRGTRRLPSTPAGAALRRSSRACCRSLDMFLTRRAADVLHVQSASRAFAANCEAQARLDCVPLITHIATLPRTSARTWTTSKSLSVRGRGCASSSTSWARCRRAFCDLCSIPDLACIACKPSALLDARFLLPAPGRYIYLTAYMNTPGRRLSSVILRAGAPGGGVGLGSGGGRGPPATRHGREAPRDEGPAAGACVLCLTVLLVKYHHDDCCVSTSVGLRFV